jgi:hypothetical protein
MLFLKTGMSSPSQEISHLLWNLKVHYHVHNRPPLTPILIQMNPVITLTHYVLKFHFNIILVSGRTIKGCPPVESPGYKKERKTEEQLAKIYAE